MKAALVESHRERLAPDRVRRADRRRHEPLHTTEPSPLTADADGGILVVDPEVEAERRAARRAMARRSATRPPSTRRSQSSRASRATSRENIMPATIAAARAGATTGEWAQTLRDVFGEYRAPTGVGEAAAVLERGDRRAARGGRAGQRRARPPAQVPGRQARPRRPLQRRRADRRARARCRHGRRLRGHPADAHPDRHLGRPGGRPRGRPVDPVGLALRADPGGARRRCARPGSARSRSSSAGSSPRPTPSACARPAWPPSTRPRTGISTG